MKALFLTNEFPPHIYGGAGVHVDYLTRELRKLMEVDVRCYGDQLVTDGPLSVKGYGGEEPLFQNTDKQIKGAFQALEKGLRFNADPVDADVVHCHTWYSHFGGVLTKLAYGLPLVVTTHSLEPHRPWKREQLGRGYDVSSWIEKTALEMADCVIAVSRGMKRDVLSLFDVPEERIKVIYNGIDTDEYKKVGTKDALIRHGVNPDLPYVLFVGRITRQKGIIHLVNAIKYLKPGLQVVLCAGAPDTKEIAAEMAVAVRKAKEERPEIIWIEEMVDHKTVIEFYSHAAVFCCPSIYEPFGIINLEAMACGTPVVASSVGGIKEVVIHGETGLQVPMNQFSESPFEPKDPDRFSRDLALAINELMKDESLRKKMGDAGRRRAVEVFSWKAIARETAALYASLIKK